MSRRSRHAFGQNTRGISWENLQEKCCNPDVRRTFCVSLRNDMHMDISQEPFKSGQLMGKAPHARTATPVLREPAGSKSTRTCRKSRFMQKFTGKCRAPDMRRVFCVSLCSRVQIDKTQEPFYAEICSENAALQSKHFDQAPASALTVRTLCVDALCRE